MDRIDELKARMAKITKELRAEFDNPNEERYWLLIDERNNIRQEIELLTSNTIESTDLIHKFYGIDIFLAFEDALTALEYGINSDNFSEAIEVLESVCANNKQVENGVYERLYVFLINYK